MNVISSFLLFVGQGIVTFAVFIFVIGLLVFVHELGHFLAAKFLGVRVNEFALGFGKNLYKREWKGTTYKINLLPLGGYVSLEGEDHADKKAKQGKENFQNQPLWAKAIILLAGIFMNLIFAVVLMAIYLPISNYQVSVPYADLDGDHLTVDEFDFAGKKAGSGLSYGVWVLDVLENSPAEGKLQNNYIINSLNDEVILGKSEFADFLALHEGEEVEFGYISVDLDTGMQNGEGEVTLVLGEKTDESERTLGVGYEIIPLNYALEYPAVITSAVAHTANIFNYQITILSSSVRVSIAEGDPSVVGDQVNSIAAVGLVIGRQLGDLSEIVNLAAVVSLSLAFFNLLPLPLLDGGQLAIYTVERIRGRKLNEKALSIMNQTTFIFLVVLSVFLIFRDIIRFQMLEGIISSLQAMLNR